MLAGIYIIYNLEVTLVGTISTRQLLSTNPASGRSFTLHWKRTEWSFTFHISVTMVSPGNTWRENLTLMLLNLYNNRIEISNINKKTLYSILFYSIILYYIILFIFILDIDINNNDR